MSFECELNLGDRVRHTTFPPVEGYVSITERIANTNVYKVAVLKDDGNLYWDTSLNWEVIGGTIPNTPKEEDIIDVDYIEVQ